MGRRKKTIVEKIKEKRKRCLEALGDPCTENTLRWQITDLARKMAVFQIIRTSLKMSMDADEEEKLNHPVLEFIHDCFLAFVTTGIRRLSDASKGLTGKHGVYSLIAVLDEMKGVKGRDLLEAEGYEYRTWDDEFQVRCAIQNNPDISEKQKRTFSLDECRSRVVDDLCGVEKEKLGDGDTVDFGIDKQRKKVDDATKKIAEWATKNIAHSATKKSRENVGNIKFEEMMAVLKTLDEVTRYVSTTVLYHADPPSTIPSGMGGLVFERIHFPLVQEDQIETLEKVWKKIESEWEQRL